MLLYNPAPSREFQSYAQHLQQLDNRYRQHQQQILRAKNTTPATASRLYAATTSFPRVIKKPVATRFPIYAVSPSTRPVAINVNIPKPIDFDR